VSCERKRTWSCSWNCSWATNFKSPFEYSSACTMAQYWHIVIISRKQKHLILIRASTLCLIDMYYALRWRVRSHLMTQNVAQHMNTCRRRHSRQSTIYMAQQMNTCRHSHIHGSITILTQHSNPSVNNTLNMPTIITNWILNRSWRKTLL
jgi:hypothetical protein